MKVIIIIYNIYIYNIHKFYFFSNFVAPCLKEKTEPCFKLIEGMICMRLRQELKNKRDLPRPCRRDGLLDKVLRYDPHPLQDEDL